MRHFLLTRAAYGDCWALEANQRRLEFSQGVTIPSIRAQTSRRFEWLVLLHRADPLRAEREAAFAPARFLYLDEAVTGSPQSLAWQAYGADWAGAIGPRDDTVAMTRLDDDDALAPWAMERIETEAGRLKKRAIIVLPHGIRVFRGRFTVVRHETNAMQTLVTLPGDDASVYDYGHREARNFAPVKLVDGRIAWLWSRHNDTISGWKIADHELTPAYRAMFPIDWRLFGDSLGRRRTGPGGRVFR